MAVTELYNDNVNDKELTAFTSLDLEKFYETKWNLVPDYFIAPIG